MTRLARSSVCEERKPGYGYSAVSKEEQKAIIIENMT
jgi:hypothetical protein